MKCKTMSAQLGPFHISLMEKKSKECLLRVFSDVTEVNIVIEELLQNKKLKKKNLINMTMSAEKTKSIKGKWLDFENQ